MSHPANDRYYEAKHEALQERKEKVGRKMSGKHFEHLVSARDTRQGINDEIAYWKKKKGEGNIRVKAKNADDAGGYTARISVRKGH